MLQVLVPDFGGVLAHVLASLLRPRLVLPRLCFACLAASVDMSRVAKTVPLSKISSTIQPVLVGEARRDDFGPLGVWRAEVCSGRVLGTSKNFAVKVRLSSDFALSNFTDKDTNEQSTCVSCFGVDAAGSRVSLTFWHGASEKMPTKSPKGLTVGRPPGCDFMASLGRS